MFVRLGSHCSVAHLFLVQSRSAITSYANWHSNIEYHLSLNKEFASFLAADWSKKSITNRGLADDTADAGNQRR